MRATAATAIPAFVAGLVWASHLNAHGFDDGVTFGANMALRGMDNCASMDRNIVECMHAIAETEHFDRRP